MTAFHHDRAGQMTGALMAAVAAVAFSGKAIIVKLAYRHGVDAITLLALRMLYSAPMFLLLAFWAGSRGAPRLSPRDYAKLSALGLLGYHAASLFDFLGLQYITAALERLVLFLYPTFVMVYAALFGGIRITSRAVAALAVSYAGIILVFVNDLTTQQSNVVLGTFWVLAAALCYAAYLIGSERMVGRVGTFRFACMTSLAACAGVMVHFAIVRPVASLTGQGTAVHGLALLMASVSTVLPVVFTTAAVHRVGSSTVAVIGTLGPVATVFLGYSLLDEPITGIQLAGAAMVTAGVVVVSAGRSSTSRGPVLEADVTEVHLE
jgi:drug/metabolite transporter (DMT)-like permease